MEAAAAADEAAQPRLQGVVIISLPPPDDPSKGKTITAFTLSNPPLPRRQSAFPTRSPLPPPVGHRLSLSPKKAAAVLLGAAVVALSLWVCLFSEAPYQLLTGSNNGQRRREADSILLRLYPKNRTSAPSPEVKLGSLKIGNGVRMKRSRTARLGSTFSRADSSPVLPIRGNVLPDGQYYTSVYVGNPPRPFFLDVDTGSDLTWIQCDAPCSNCAEGPHPLYRPTKEKIVLSKDSLCIELQSYQNYVYCDSCQQCDYEIEYADHSSSMGVLARDDMHLITSNGDLAKFSFAFGCAYDQQGQLLASPAKTDGILGLSGAKVSLPSQLASQGITSNVVGHCINSAPHGIGYMFFGDDFVPRWGMTWIAALGGLINFYSAEVHKVTYGRQQLNAAKRGSNAVEVVFDSGSSYTYFTRDTYCQLINSLKDMAHDLVQDNSDPALPVCWRADVPIRSLEDVKQFFEPLTLQFERRWWAVPKILTIPPEGYLLINKGNVCLGVLNGTEVIDGSTIILGDISLRGKLVVYDNVHQRIGWLQSDCVKPQRPRGFPFFF